MILYLEDLKLLADNSFITHANLLGLWGFLYSKDEFQLIFSLWKYWVKIHRLPSKVRVMDGQIDIETDTRTVSAIIIIDYFPKIILCADNTTTDKISKVLFLVWFCYSILCSLFYQFVLSILLLGAIIIYFSNNTAR